MARRRSRLVALGVTAVLAASATGCGAPEEESNAQPDHTGICVDRSTGIRLDDAVCAADRVPPSEGSPSSPAATPSPSPRCTPTTATPTPSSTGGMSPEGTATPPSPCPPGQALTDGSGSNGSTTHRSHGWYFIPWGSSAPAVGARASGGSYSEPRSGSYSVGGVAASGGRLSSSSFSKAKSTIVRGGFGSSGSKGGS
ncbi:hypothetical protein [Austwickia chelonae]|uniref:hypothetical protein n=1 Tax=Austwickia chelonae TaxID=100225 RepID=UPI0013C36651|nr:hypothetical protein [Austwickia chelonae]